MSCNYGLGQEIFRLWRVGKWGGLVYVDEVDLFIPETRDLMYMYVGVCLCQVFSRFCWGRESYIVSVGL